MIVDREQLLAALKAASLIVDPNHSIDIFQKVWLLEGYVLGFNATGMVSIVPVDIPRIGGIEGKLLMQLLERLDTDEVEMFADDRGHLVVKGEETVINLTVMDETENVHVISKVPELDNVTEFSVATLFEDIQLSAMMQLHPLKDEPMPDFMSMAFDINDKGKATIYTSDRYSVNRSVMNLETYEPGYYLVPLEFMKLLIKNKELFIDDGTIAFNKNSIVVTNEDGAGLFCRLLKNFDNNRIDFDGVVKRIWPDGKFDPKRLVDIPEELKNILTQAKLVSKDENDSVHLSVKDGQLTVSATGKNRSKFKATLNWDHVDCQVSVTCSRLLQALSNVERMTLLERAVAFRGPNKFWRFIAGKS